MRVAFHDLSKRLEKGLEPIYLITGDEPLQCGEAADAVRAAARKRGFTEREVLEADARFDWNRLLAEANSLSLFADRRIIDLRIPSGKPGLEGGKALAEYAQRPPPDVLLLISMPKADQTQTKSKWFNALDGVGAVVQIWPIEGERLGPWIEQRMRGRGLIPEREVVPMLAERIEGNLLAASQEIEKLLLLHGPGVVSAERLLEAVADSARFDVYGLVDSALEGKVARTLRILNGLRGEGIAEAVVLWALARELRLLASLAPEVEKGRPAGQVVGSRNDIWQKRRPLVTQGLQRLRSARLRELLRLCARTDRAIKGRGEGEPWMMLQEIALGMAGARVVIGV